MRQQDPVSYKPESTFYLDISAKKFFFHLSQTTFLDERLSNENNSTFKMYQLQKHAIKSPNKSETTDRNRLLLLLQKKKVKTPSLQNNQAVTEMQSTNQHFRRKR